MWQAHTCNLDTWEVEAGGPEVQSHFQLVVSSRLASPTQDPVSKQMIVFEVTTVSSSGDMSAAVLPNGCHAPLCARVPGGLSYRFCYDQGLAGAW